jgi:hypothetical protein
MPPIHRLIYQKQFGSIPIDENGVNYDIHHIDGNRKNNDISNLRAVSLQEHYDIHYNQGDWMACQRIMMRMEDDPKIKSQLLSKSNSDRLKNGTHNFLNKEWHQQMREKRSDTWEVVFPNGDILVVKNLKQFCIQNGLNQGAMNQVGIGKKAHHKGYSCRKIMKGKIQGKKMNHEESK